MDQDTRTKIETLRDIVWDKDIPSPIFPATIAHHRDITEILKYIDTELLKEE